MSNVTIDENEAERKISFGNEALTHQDALYNYALKIVQNTDDAHDLLQETYYKAYKNYHQFEKGTNCKAWMFMILKNTFINNYRKSKNEPIKIDYNEIGDIYKNIKSEQIQINPDFDLSYNLLDDELFSALENLPSKMKKIFFLYDLKGYNYEEIAEISNIPVGTVRSRLHRTRKLLQEKLFSYAKVNGYLN